MSLGPPLPEKEELERQKLHAEIELLDGQRVAQRHELERRGWVWFQSWFPVATVLCTVVTVGIQSCQYLQQQRRLYEVQIDQGLLSLAQSLSDPQLERRENSALLLSAYESDAIPILLSHLRMTNEPRAVIESLRLIQGKKRVGQEGVSRQLLDSAKVLFSAYDPRSGTSPYVNYVRALSQLAQTDDQEAAALLGQLRRRLDTSSATQADTALIKIEISQGCQALVRKDCS